MEKLKVTDEADASGRTPLHYASLNDNSSSVVQLLLAAVLVIVLLRPGSQSCIRRDFLLHRATAVV